MKCICINDKDRPNEIPLSKWVEKGKEYTITKVMIMKIQGSIAGVKLAELNIDDYFPYQYFALWRFAFPISEMAKLIEEKELVEEI
jgi:hypothetical protein